ncbi:hypothetical protein QCA50_015574 [Cerrena zonata]|uniref:Aminoglycoside phosphotransferase domain-containing protein n=1 Tax=Cerrena zonata TaxID=2478898 RepID=A0AAW0FQD3_9APHY
MRLDISTQKYIASKTSIPIPRIHAASMDTNNPLRHPYTISDFVPGTNLCKVWNDASWWTEGREKDRVLRSIARWMVELSSLEFDKVGRLDYDELTDTTTVVSYTSIREFHSGLDDSSEPFGPFTTTHAFSSALILGRRMARDSPTLALLQLYLSALSDSRFDGPPFVLGHPDFDSQNILIDEAGNITGLIDWDGVDVGPRQLNALSYPSWLTVDWDPLFYGWSAEASPEDNQAYDSPSELANYRHMYLAAIDDLSEGKLTEVTRNSHILSTLHIALCNPIATSGIMDHIGKFVLGSSSMTYELEDAIKAGSWFALGPNPSNIAEVIVNDEESLLEGNGDRTDDRSDE